MADINSSWGVGFGGSISLDVILFAAGGDDFEVISSSVAGTEGPWDRDLEKHAAVVDVVSTVDLERPGALPLDAGTIPPASRMAIISCS